MTTYTPPAEAVAEAVAQAAIAATGATKAGCSIEQVKAAAKVAYDAVIAAHESAWNDDWDTEDYYHEQTRAWHAF